MTDEEKIAVHVLKNIINSIEYGGWKINYFNSDMENHFEELGGVPVRLSEKSFTIKISMTPSKLKKDVIE